MAEVYAIKDVDKVKRVGKLLNKHYGRQMADVWELGVNLALRISDLLSVKFVDVKGDRLVLVESKTNKRASIQLNSKALDIVRRRRREHPEHTYIFESHRSRYMLSRAPKPLSRRSVSKAFQSVGESIDMSLGTHSMRKTRGYHLYQATNDISRVMKMLRHSSEAQTLRYIGITQQDIDSDFKQLVL